jgi:hypothetical protein
MDPSEESFFIEQIFETLIRNEALKFLGEQALDYPLEVIQDMLSPDEVLRLRLIARISVKTGTNEEILLTKNLKELEELDRDESKTTSMRKSQEKLASIPNALLQPSVFDVLSLDLKMLIMRELDNRSIESWCRSTSTNLKFCKKYKIFDVVGRYKYGREYVDFLDSKEGQSMKNMIRRLRTFEIVKGLLANSKQIYPAWHPSPGELIPPDVGAILKFGRNRILFRRYESTGLNLYYTEDDESVYRPVSELVSRLSKMMMISPPPNFIKGGGFIPLVTGDIESPENKGFLPILVYALLEKGWTFDEFKYYEGVKKEDQMANVTSPICENCGKEAPKQCKRCKKVKYCGRTCQVQHWKSTHKFECTNPFNDSSSE